MHTIIVTDKYKNKTIAEIIALYADEMDIHLPVSECFVALTTSL